MMISEFAVLHGMSAGAVSRYLSAYYPHRYKVDHPELGGGLDGYVRPSTPDDLAFDHVLQMRTLIIEKRAKNADIAAKIVLGFDDQPIPPQIAREIKDVLREIDNRLTRIEYMIENVDKYIASVIEQRSSRRQTSQLSILPESTNIDVENVKYLAESEMAAWRRESEQAVADISLIDLKDTSHDP